MAALETGVQIENPSSRDYLPYQPELQNRSIHHALILLAQGYNQKEIEERRVKRMDPNLGNQILPNLLTSRLAMSGCITVDSWIIESFRRGELSLLEAIESYDFSGRKRLNTNITDITTLQVRYPALDPNEIAASLNMQAKQVRDRLGQAREKLKTGSPIQTEVVVLAAGIARLDLLQKGQDRDQDLVIRELQTFEAWRVSQGFDWDAYLHARFPLAENTEAKADAIYQQKKAARKAQESKPEEIEPPETFKLKDPTIHFRPKTPEDVRKSIELMLDTGIGVLMLGRQGLKTRLRLLAAAPTGDDLIRGLVREDHGSYFPIASIVDDFCRNQAGKRESYRWQETLAIESGPATSWKVFVVDSRTSSARESALNPWVKQIIKHIMDQLSDSDGQRLRLPAELEARLADSQE